MKTEKKQYLVKLNSELEGNDFINLLENNGYVNTHNISYKDLQVKVIAVGKNNFFGVNVTSLACAVNCGKKCISVDEFKNVVELKSNEVGLN